ncbi:MAG: hypothetical protein HQL31_10265 [Planctomycetes bacterium]|nr:hypothetical protein [Planctomycetota bacterium]
MPDSPLLTTPLVSPPDKELSNYCAGRLQGLRLTSDDKTYRLLCEAVEMGLSMLRLPEKGDA